MHGCSTMHCRWAGLSRWCYKGPIGAKIERHDALPLLCETYQLTANLQWVATVAKLPPKRKQENCVASGCFVYFSVRGEWPLPICARGGYGSIAVSDRQKLSDRNQS